MLLKHERVPRQERLSQCHVVALFGLVMHGHLHPIYKMEAVTQHARVPVDDHVWNRVEQEAKMYYHVDYFRERVPRIILPPSKLYPRVRAVYELYGNMVDSKTNVP